jgi:hypothetical protein
MQRCSAAEVPYVVRSIRYYFVLQPQRCSKSTMHMQLGDAPRVEVNELGARLPFCSTCIQLEVADKQDRHRLLAGSLGPMMIC